MGDIRNRMPVAGRWLAALAAVSMTATAVALWASGSPPASAAFAAACIPLSLLLLRREALLARLERANAMLEMAEKSARLGHWRVTARDGVYWSDEMFAIYGLPRGTTPAMARIRELLHPDDIDHIDRTVAESMMTGEPYRMVARIIRPDGVVRYIESHGTPERDGAGRMVNIFGTFQDVTERMEAMQKLELAKRSAEREARDSRSLAETDELTGIFNRRKILAMLESEIAASEANGASLSIAILDIDHFKSINDRFGHGAGDAVLSRVARIGQLNLRRSDVIGRLGGEEFLLVMPGTDPGAAQDLIERLRIAIAQSAWPELEGLEVTGSFGLATLVEGADATWLVQAADNALYEAKRAGRNCHRVAAAA